MNTLRKLVEELTEYYADAEDFNESNAYSFSASRLSAEIPKWERLADMLEEPIEGATDSDHVVLVHVPSVRAALSEVQ